MIILHALIQERMAFIVEPASRPDVWHLGLAPDGVAIVHQLFPTRDSGLTFGEWKRMQN